MDAKANRAEWMRQLVQKAGGPAAWVASYGADYAKWSAAQVSQWTSKTAKPIGHDLARRLEKAQGLPYGTLDTAPDVDAAAQSQLPRFDDETMSQAVDLLYLMGDARPDDKRFSRLTWPMILVAAKCVARAEGDPRGAMADILAELSEV